MTSLTDRAERASALLSPWQGRRPEHPGRLLERCYLIPLHISQTALARELGISRRRINEIVNGQRAITADTALKLAAFFRTTPMFWLEKQQLWELCEAGKRKKSAH
ncbi:MAG: addiction module antidote protein, HigA family [Oceanospirillaceae bacterium]|uniref:HigA family addiction module antitoxin n=1 Tax=Marinobacterium litorale TaxID=404770 RepID=UPI0004247AA2|nr:HigA family addiction module antitoxin [Marinobacterium litorale]MBS98791.1 addiction module antidote protein, HigA family [Oceanospirillaceae bacterium]